MKAPLTLCFALLVLCAGAALAQGTPDLMTPAQETVCNSETGAAFGLCNAYCEAMDCESANPQASATACSKVKTKFTNITGHALPCETCPPPPPGTTCPCVDAFADFNTVLNGTALLCVENGTFIAKQINFSDAIAASCSAASPFGVFCGAETRTGGLQILNVSPEEGQACVQLIRQSCTPE